VIAASCRLAYKLYFEVGSHLSYAAKCRGPERTHMDHVTSRSSRVIPLFRARLIMTKADPLLSGMAQSASIAKLLDQADFADKFQRV
jgi:hypothetical protein